MLQNLIKSEQNLIDCKEQCIKNNQTLVFTNGCFDLLHIGHIRYLQASQALGHKLLIGLNSDKSVSSIKPNSEIPRPLNTELVRAEMLLALKSVDYIYIFEELTADRVLEILQPDIYTKGGDYKEQSLPEYKTLKQYNIQFQSIRFENNYSSTNIIHSILRKNNNR